MVVQGVQLIIVVMGEEMPGGKKVSGGRKCVSRFPTRNWDVILTPHDGRLR